MPVASEFVMVYPLALLRIWRLNMLIKFYKIRLLFLLSSALMLCQCTTAVSTPEPVSEPVVTIKKKIQSPYSLPTASYLAMAEKQDGQKKQELLISAAGRLISEGQWRQGSAILAQTSELTADQRNEKNLLLAKVDLMRDRYQAALAKLADIHAIDNLPTYHQIQYHELLAQSYRALGNNIEAVSQRIKLEPLLVDNDSQVNNRRALWLTLNNVETGELTSKTTEASNQAELQGWLKLALISRQYRDNASSLLAALKQWQSQFSAHPANQMLPNPLDSIANKMLPSPKKVALLVPLSGPLSGPGNAIREGFTAASKGKQAESSTQIKTYDTNNGDISAMYQQAVSDGAEYIVGPLTKAQVAVVAAMEHPVPTLLLNDSEVSAQENSYSFGLSPSNEAIQVANKAHSKGYSKALVIAPQNDWGNEITRAFATQWQEHGGKVVATFNYAANDDLNKKMRDFLHISDSQAREKQLKLLLGQSLQTSTSRRQDFDMIFLLAYPSKARQIMPLLKYYYAGNVPVYATSNAYGGNANALKDKDLDGLIFCDIPWVFSHQMGERNWPEQLNSYNRLYALGVDSYALATQLNQLILFPADGSKDTSGSLYLKSSQQVARVLEWGQFRQGLVHSLGETV